MTRKKRDGKTMSIRDNNTMTITSQTERNMNEWPDGMVDASDMHTTWAVDQLLINGPYSILNKNHRQCCIQTLFSGRDLWGNGGEGEHIEFRRRNYSFWPPKTLIHKSSGKGSEISLFKGKIPLPSPEATQWIQHWS